MLRRTIPCATATAAELYQYGVDHTQAGWAKAHKMVIDRASGAYLYDVEGKKYLDFTVGIGVCNFGHCNPRIVKAVQKQTEQLWHAQVCHGYHTPMLNLIKKMEKHFPKELDSYVFTTTGGEALESAVRMARQATGRQNIICLNGSFHGRSMGAAAMTSSKMVYSRNIRPLMPGVTFVPCPYASHFGLPANTSMDELNERAFYQVKDTIERQMHPTEAAMLVLEPTLGEGGYVPLPTPYYQKVREYCAKHNIMFVVDEVQSGYGRTGTMFNYDQFSSAENPIAAPDGVCFAKGIANGLPLAGLVCKTEHARKQCPGTQGGTYSGNCLATAAAIEVLDILETGDIQKNVLARSKQLYEGLQKMSTDANKKYPVQEIRGLGLMIGLQFLDNAPAGFAGVFAEEAFNAGLVLLTTSTYETVRLIPPLTLTEEEANEALEKIDTALAKAVERTKFQPETAAKEFKPCCPTPCRPGGNGQFCRHVAHW